jgi:hypothetical protein
MYQHFPFQGLPKFTQFGIFWHANLATVRSAETRIFRLVVVAEGRLVPVPQQGPAANDEAEVGSALHKVPPPQHAAILVALSMLLQAWSLI